MKEKKPRRCVPGRNFVCPCTRHPEWWLLHQTLRDRGASCWTKPLWVEVHWCFYFCSFVVCTDFQNLFTIQLQVKDPRFEWTRDKMLVLKEVTHDDQGLYAIKLSSGFTYETVRLTVSGTIVSSLSANPSLFFSQCITCLWMNEMNVNVLHYKLKSFIQNST